MTETNNELALVVDTPADAGERADVVLGRRLPGVSRRVARRLGLEGHLYLDGRKIPPSTRVPAGSRLALRVAHGGTAQPVTVLASTDHFVYVLKPPGMHTHRLRPDDASTLADAVALAHPECREASPDPRQGGAVHRLDRGTTGVIAFARTLEAWRIAREAFRSRRVLKLYRALVRADPDSDPWPPQRTGLTTITETAPVGPWPTAQTPGLRIAAPLGPSGRRRVMVRADGRAAVTEAWSLDVDDAGHREMLLRLVTGHRHQARVHLAWLGHPIVGDSSYDGTPSARLRLHAAVLDLSEGCPGEPRVQAPMPDDWTVA
ncbi:MAG: RluA family pseudouridine synthase [Deltaproteobacteria bacterium]|nr:RluA family pseudouridine synthase [Deltaproteobacteria bacterium]